MTTRQGQMQREGFPELAWPLEPVAWGPRPNVLPKAVKAARVCSFGALMVRRELARARRGALWGPGLLLSKKRRARRAPIPGTEGHPRV
jgi:hypothetical protein